MISDCQYNSIHSAIRAQILAHGQVFNIYIPVIFSEQSHNKTNFTQKTTQKISPLDWNTAKIIDLLVKIIQIINPDDINSQNNQKLQWPPSIQQYKLYNITKKTLTYNQYINHSNKITDIFTSKASSIKKLKLYLQWPVDIIQLSFMNCCFMNYQVRNRNLPLKYMVNQFAQNLETELMFARKIKLIIKSIPEGKQIDQSIKFSQYRVTFPLKTNPNQSQLSLQLVNQVDLSFEQIKKLFKKLQIQLSTYLCPISYELMIYPCYLRPCMHYFDENSIRVSLNKYKYCPFCKTKAGFQDVVSDDLLRKAIHHILEEALFEKEVQNIMKANKNVYAQKLE